MTTILLSAAGAAVGGSLGGTVLGLSSAVLGRAVGATLGRVIDQRLLGSGAEPIESGKVDRFRLNGSGEGAPVAQVYGRMRLGGQVIWASDFLESSSTSGGGKGAPSTPKTTTYSYTVSLAVAICAGQIAGINRIWADGEEVSADEIGLRVYTGSDDQMPDPAIEAIEGAGQVPAYRGTAYAVMENLSLDQFGNRVPQFSFEVVRPEQPGSEGFDEDPAQAVRGVALVPGTGEYALATTPVYLSNGPGENWPANINSPSGKSDFETSIDALGAELPGCGAASLVVSWFGDDLRCGDCQILPKMERREVEGSNMPWRVAGLTRASAQEIPRQDDRPIYGGTPADTAVIEAIRHLQASGQEVMFYPFILMEQSADNALPDPWSDADSQPALPWRGRITLSQAPGRDGSPDGSAAAEAEVVAFFGSATAADFTISGDQVGYTGPDEWGLRRFILHYAALCAAAGGVESFCIGSEMHGLTQIRGAGGQFCAVQQLRQLAAEVRQLLGPDTKISYAADWTEYAGYQPADGSGDRYFHLDALWADDNIDFVGIDNYMPVSDWREGVDHADAGWGSIYNPAYLDANIEGGEGFDWYYHSPEARAAQIRTEITDGAYDEPWIWRYKDIRSWWAEPHHDRVAGQRLESPTGWMPRSKPIRFTELGCAAINKGTNQPNKFLDAKSSESALPHYSNGVRDDLIQHQYLKVILAHWSDPANNPQSDLYEGRMLDMDHAYVWAWDARPFPAFPNMVEQWSDGENYARGHWLNGRSGSRSLASVVQEICDAVGLTAIDTSELYGIVRGFAVEDVGEARAALQPLMLRYGFDAIERDGVLKFVMRDGAADHDLDPQWLAESGEIDGTQEFHRDGEAEMVGRVRLRFVQSDADFDVLSEEAVLPDEATHAVASSELALSMTRGEGRQTVERWLAEARVSRDRLRLALPPSRLDVRAGDVLRLPSENGVDLYRVDRVEIAELQLIEAVRIEPAVYAPSQMPEDLPGMRAFVPPLPVTPLFMDLPLIAGDEVEHAPHIAVTGKPWPGSAAVYSAISDENYALDQIVQARAVVGTTQNPLVRAAAGRWDRGAALQVKLISGTLESRSHEAVLNGANLAAIGDGSSGRWELLQFEAAELIGPDTYLISNRLRGQLGSDGLIPDVWPEGSWFVLLNEAPQQIGLKPGQLRTAQHYRIGPANRPYSDPAYTHRIEAFDGNGLRPYAPCHLRAQRDGGGEIALSWMRRSRVDGDRWDLAEIPLGEESESYLLRVMAQHTVLREISTTVPSWTYGAAEQAADAATPATHIDVAQLSARYGPGLFASVRLPEPV